MSRNARLELLSVLSPDYRRVNRTEKAKILEAFVAATGYSRKHAIALLNHSAASPARKRPERKHALDSAALEALSFVWRTSNRICGKRLVALLPDVLDNLEAHGHLSLNADVKRQLLSVSAATIDRMLKAERAKVERSKSLTRKPPLVKSKIPVRTFTEWSEVSPGFFEIDTVAHSSSDARGPFLSTLNMTDIATCWTLPMAMPKKDAFEVIRALDKAKKLLPFPILGLDFDNGSEFLNQVLVKWCQSNRVSYTRSREYKKNDQAWIEEKNGSVVRRNVGRDRYEGNVAHKKLDQLYSVLYLYFNFFQPCQKLVSKKRDGAKCYKKHDRAMTPYTRLLESGRLSDDQKQSLINQRKKLDMYSLFKDLERLQAELKQVAIDIPDPLLAAALAQRNATHNFLLHMPNTDHANTKPTISVASSLSITKTKGSGLTKLIRRYIAKLEPGSKVRSNQFREFADANSVLQVLHRLTKQRILKRVGLGIFEVRDPAKEKKLSRHQLLVKAMEKILSETDPTTFIRPIEYYYLANKSQVSNCFHDLEKRGIIKRVSWGIYQICKPDLRQKSIPIVSPAGKKTNEATVLQGTIFK